MYCNKCGTNFDGNFCSNCGEARTSISNHVMPSNLALQQSKIKLLT